MKEEYIYRVIRKTREDFETEEDFELYIEEFNDKLKLFKFKTLPQKLTMSKNEFIPSGDLVLFKIEKQKPNSDLVNFIFNYYNDIGWQKQNLYDENDKPIESVINNYKDIGIIFDLVYGEKEKTMKYVVRDTKEVRKMFAMWRLEFNFETDGILMLTISDANMPAFVGASVLEKYCGKSIKEMLDCNFIEKVMFDKTGYVTINKDNA